MPSPAPASASIRPSWPPPTIPTRVTVRRGSGCATTFSVWTSRNFSSCSRMCSSSSATISAASSPAFTAPLTPIASEPTGTPAGICTIDRSESIPFKAFDSIGTPRTGRCVFAAVIPGRCAAPPAPATITRSPRSAAVFAYSTISSGVRWAETTFVSNRTPRSSRVSQQCFIVSQSEREPMITPTCGSSIEPSLATGPGRRGRD